MLIEPGGEDEDVHVYNIVYVYANLSLLHITRAHLLLC